MVGGNIFKYGLVEPHHGPLFRPMIIKYGPLEPREPQIVDRPEDEQREKEIKSILKQIDKCLKDIENLLKGARLLATLRQDISQSNTELGVFLGELMLLYTKLCNLQGSANNQAMEYRPGKRHGTAVILYIVITPARPPKK